MSSSLTGTTPRLSTRCVPHVLRRERHPHSAQGFIAQLEDRLVSNPQVVPRGNGEILRAPGDESASGLSLRTTITGTESTLDATGLTVLILVFAPLSGAQFNPVVIFSLVRTGRAALASPAVGCSPTHSRASHRTRLGVHAAALPSRPSNREPKHKERLVDHISARIDYLVTRSLRWPTTQSPSAS